MSSRRTHWQLPPGVEPGTWEYAHRASIANDYDEYFAGHKLFALDDHLLDSWLPPTTNDAEPVIADLGCGTGRALLPLVARGYQGLAIDLSPLMLEQVRRKSEAQQLNVRCLCANLAQLEGLREACIDHAICLFSTLGMIKGHEHRAEMLRHTCRVLKPGGRLFLHVHNLWCNLMFPGGWKWLASSGLKSMGSSGVELGDKYYPYRGLNNMYLHVFRRREIETLLERSGFRELHITPLSATLGEPLERSWWLPGLRASGWWIVAQKPKA